jgi:hypothetical protein
MMGSVKVTGIGTVQTQLRNIARKVPEESRKVLVRKAEQIVALAKIMVPEDTGALMESIRIERGYERPGGRLYINVVVANKVITLENGREIDLNQYALIIHETYSSMKPGKTTIAKQRSNPSVIVGEKFLTRAADRIGPTINPDMYQVIDQVILGETE